MVDEFIHLSQKGDTMCDNTVKLNSNPKCGEIWMCNIPSKDGSVQSGYRPVFILSNNMNNTYARTLNVIPLTTKMNKRRLPIHVELWNYQAYGLQRPSTMLIEQIATVSAENLDRCVGSISDRAILMNIVSAINIQFPIMQLQHA